MVSEVKLPEWTFVKLTGVLNTTASKEIIIQLVQVRSLEYFAASIDAQRAENQARCCPEALTTVFLRKCIVMNQKKALVAAGKIYRATCPSRASAAKAECDARPPLASVGRKGTHINSEP